MKDSLCKLLCSCACGCVSKSMDHKFSSHIWTCCHDNQENGGGACCRELKLTLEHGNMLFISKRNYEKNELNVDKITKNINLKGYRLNLDFSLGVS